MQKYEDTLTLKSSLNEQQYFFLTFNMKKCRLFFVVADLFLSEINHINIYVTKCGMFTEKCKTSFDNSVLCEVNIQQKP